MAWRKPKAWVERNRMQRDSNPAEGRVYPHHINGTFALLTEAKLYWESLGPGDKERFRSLHVSTYEV
jgi:hypothetical protein